MHRAIASRLLPLLALCLIPISASCDRSESHLNEREELALKYIRSVLKGDESHRKLELAGLSLRLRTYSYFGSEWEWKTIEGKVRVIDSVTKSKGPGLTKDLDDYFYGLSGEGPYTTGNNGVAEIIQLRIADEAGQEYWALVALRPDHADQPLTKGRSFDWSEIRWKVVPPPAL